MGLLEKGKANVKEKVKTSHDKDSYHDNKSENKTKLKDNPYHNLQGLGKKEHIHTKLDKIYDKIVKNKKVKISELARSCKCTTEDIENWLKLLQKQGLVVISYPTIGEAYASIDVDSDEIGESEGEDTRTHDKNKKGENQSKDIEKVKKKKLIYFTIFSIIIVTIIMIIIKRFI
jgi:hypothetical protein